MEDVRAKKDELRARLRAARAPLTVDELRSASAAVCRALRGVDAIARAGTVAVYAANRGEIDPAELAAELEARGGRVVYPRVDGEWLRFHAARASELAPGAFQILEPPAAAPRVALEDVQVVLVPALALDRGGHRLGYGRGYYDAALAAAPRALRVGLCHSFQLFDELPRGSGDEPVDLLVTPDGARATRARAVFAPEEVLP